MRSLLLTAALACTLGLTACATPTPYQPESWTTRQEGGYADQRIGRDRFRVVFSGNSLTSRETVERYLLYRSAELTVQHGYDWFVLADRATNRDTRQIVEPDPMMRGWSPGWYYYRPATGWGYWDPWGYDPFWGSSTYVREVTKFQATAEIRTGSGRPPRGDRAYVAREVMANLGPTIVRPS